jgi:hypothetical protein
MSDYFLNKIYDSLISKKPVPKKPEPIVEKKKTHKTLTESYQLVKERSKASIAKDIVDVAPELKIGSKGGQIRIQPKQREPFPEKDFMAALELAGLNLEEIVKPKEPGSQSSKYNTYVVKDKDGTIHYVVLGGGAFVNKGMDFERQLAVNLEENLNNQDSNPFYQQFKAVVGPVEFVNVKDEFDRKVNRKLTGQPRDVGPIISDITLTDSKGQKYFLSLKDKNGKTISNNGLAGMFQLRDNKVITNSSPLVDPLLQAVHMDKEKIAELIEKYKDKIPSGQKNAEPISDYNKDVIYNFLGSAIDYGYYYVRSMGQNKFNIVPLLTPEDLKKFIGEIQSVSVKYPFYAGEGMQQKRKNASILVSTTSGTFSFDLRNASAGLLPVQINLVKVR